MDRLKEFEKDGKMRLPPLGIAPKYIWDAQRKAEICSAINRCIADDYPIHVEWIEEYNELCSGNKK